MLYDPHSVELHVGGLYIHYLLYTCNSIIITSYDNCRNDASFNSIKDTALITSKHTDVSSQIPRQKVHVAEKKQTPSMNVDSVEFLYELQKFYKYFHNFSRQSNQHDIKFKHVFLYNTKNILRNLYV